MVRQAHHDRDILNPLTLSLSKGRPEFISVRPELVEGHEQDIINPVRPELVEGHEQDIINPVRPELVEGLASPHYNSSN